MQGWTCTTRADTYGLELSVQVGFLRSAFLNRSGPDRSSALQFRLVLRMSIVGLVSHPEVSTQINDLACRFELPADSV